MKKGSSGGPLQGDLFAQTPSPSSPRTSPLTPLAEPLPTRDSPTPPALPLDLTTRPAEPSMPPVEPEIVVREIGRESPESARSAATRPTAVPATPHSKFVPRAPPVTIAAPAQTSGAAAPRPWLEPEPQKRRVLTVGELTRQIKWSLEKSFPQVCVRGEISGFRGPNVRGHLYFNLKDQHACVDAKIWASLAERLKFRLRDGLEVIVEGSIDVFEPQGRYSLIISRIEPAGEGALALAFQQMKERLMAEGLFGDKRTRPQRPVPFLPRRIGVVTSTSGAALRDFLRVLHARHPKLAVLVCDARVQGDGAADEVAWGIRRLGRTDVDVIVVTRGGGSAEDLWTFNEEKVARAIFASPVPVVSAIGHEVDYTIADFVADYRAPTPSAAAEKLAPVLAELELALAGKYQRLRRAMERGVLGSHQRVERLRARIADPRRILGQKQLRLSADADRLARCARAAIRMRRDGQRELAERLARQNPAAKLRQRRQDVRALARRLQLAMGEALREHRNALQPKQAALMRASPIRRVREDLAQLHQIHAHLVQRQRQRLATRRLKFSGCVHKLNAMNPLAVLARGYAVAFRADGHLVRGASDVQPGDALAIRMARAMPSSLAESDLIEATVTRASPGATSPDDGENQGG